MQKIHLNHEYRTEVGSVRTERTESAVRSGCSGCKMCIRDSDLRSVRSIHSRPVQWRWLSEWRLSLIHI